MNGQSPESGEKDVTDIISTDGHIKYDEKKKLSLTLPLLNVVLMTTTTNTTTGTDDDDDETDNHEKATHDSEQSEMIGNESNKKKKIFESDDTFMQAIFSQTIKSTTATPTDDEPSQGFDACAKVASGTTAIAATDEMTEMAAAAPKSANAITSASQNEMDIPNENSGIDMPSTKIDMKSPKSQYNKDEPAAIYTYFHQTIDEDDSPDLDVKSKITTYSPTNTLTITNTTTTIIASTQNTTISPSDDTQANICIKFKDESSEMHQSFDNSLNNKSTASASNEEAISESEHSLTQLNSFDFDVSVSVVHFFFSFTHSLPHSLPRAFLFHISCVHFISARSLSILSSSLFLASQCAHVIC